jgi:hypothetical protein
VTVDWSVGSGTSEATMNATTAAQAATANAHE